MKRQPVIDRLMKNIYHSIDGCWYWLGALNEHGYGSMGDGNGKTILSHRASYMVHVGEIPEKMQVLHRCDNPACVNPGHLFLGTHDDSMRDRAIKERSRATKLTASVVLEIRKSSLRTCDLARLHKVSPSTIFELKTYKTWKHI